LRHGRGSAGARGLEGKETYQLVLLDGAWKLTLDVLPRIHLDFLIFSSRPTSVHELHIELSAPRAQNLTLGTIWSQGCVDTLSAPLRHGTVCGTGAASAGGTGRRREIHEGSTLRMNA
jgi:hypothetical protein